MERMLRTRGRSCNRCLAVLVACALVGGCLAGSARSQQALSPDDAAAMLLNAARLAYNQGNYPFAAERFKEFTAKFGGHKDVASAWYGLGLSLMAIPGDGRDYNGAADALNRAAGVQAFADRPLAIYHLGLARRGLGNQELALARAKPNEAAQHHNTAVQRFNEAAQQFAAAVQAFSARVKGPAGANELPDDLEWAARCSCDYAEMLLRTGKYKEAAAAVEPLLKDAVLSRSKFRNLGRYYFGYAAFMQSDYLTAGRVLSELVPFTDPGYGVHARYLLARTHHLADEREEAQTHYQALLKLFDEQVAAAKQAIGNPAAFKDHPQELARLEALAKGPAPDYIVHANFYWAVLMSEDGRFAEALDRFTQFVKLFADSPLVPEAQLRQGFCQVQLKQWAEAIKTLAPLMDHAQLGDRARWWTARAQVAAADANNAQAYQQALTAALPNFQNAADRANQQANTDPNAKLRRADILLEMADTQQRIGQNQQAANTYQVVINEKADPARVQEAAQRQATAFHLAGMYPQSDDACNRFEQAYPKSPLLAAVVFRKAENAYALAEAAFNNPNLGASRADQLKALYGEAIKRFTRSIEQYPEYAAVNFARQGLAMSHYRLEQYEEAIPVLKSIAAADRTGELATVPYVLADCLIRTAPPVTEADDALSAARLLQQLEEAVKELDGFVAAAPTAPQTPDALLKLGYCHQRTAMLLADAQERNKTLTLARQAYEKIMQQFAKDAAMPVAVFERAKCFAAGGDLGTAMNELGRFKGDPLRTAPVAPLALLRLAVLLRAQNKPADAVTLLQQCRQQHEGAMASDPARAAWVPLIQYHQGLALMESGKLAEARAQFEATAGQFAARLEGAECAWRAGQCRRLIAEAALADARTALAKPDAKPEQINAANTATQQALTQLREAGQYFESQAGAVGQKFPASQPHLRMFYEAAWCYRTLGDAEIDVARQKLADEALKKLQAEAVKSVEPGQPVPPVNAPQIDLTAVPIQASEQRARDQYANLVKAGSQAPLALVARFELAEMHAQRQQNDTAIQLLTEALNLEPPIDLAERIHLRLGSCYLARKDVNSASAQFEAVLASTDVTRAAEARYRVGEALLSKELWAGAIQQLLPFRDQEPLRNVAGVSDRAVLRLGHAYAHAKQWDASRQAFETLIGRYPQSSWIEEARYGIGWCLQNQNQFDNAVNTYTQVTQKTGAEVAARAQLQIGLCRAAQKRWPEAANALLVVPFTYDYPEHSALALSEGAGAFIEMKQPEQAARLLRRVISDHPGTPWATAAQDRLNKINEAKP